MVDILRPIFKEGELEKICRILAEITVGSGIGYILNAIKVEDWDDKNTKWKRLYNALAKKQNLDRAGNVVLSYINKALEPARFIDNRQSYLETLRMVNTVLAFHGLEFCEDGNFHKISKANNLLEAQQRASKLKEELLRRNLHNDLLVFCRSELLQENYFHAVLEATKSIASKIRLQTGLTSDGAALIDEAFGGDNPRIRINSFNTETEKGEQKGFVNLAKGLFGTFRNPTAHAAKIEWEMLEEDAVDLFTLASYVLRRIDRSI